MIISILVRIECRVPKRATIRLVMEDSEGEYVWMGAWSRIHSMTASGRVYNGLSNVSGRR